jgi:hypothetical protein
MVNRASGASSWPASEASNGEPGGVPGGAVVRSHLGHRLHRRRLGHLEHPGPEVALTPDEASIGEPYVSDDIGSYLGPPPTQSGRRSARPLRPMGAVRDLPADPAAPLERRDRLPWQYSEPVQSITEAFLRLRWLPPGRWIDYFTGATFTGPTTVSMAVPLSRLPVFVRSGGIVPEQETAATSGDPDAALSVRAYAGGSGSFDLYDDGGSGLGYTRGERADTHITTSSTSQGGEVSTEVTIAATRGRFSGQVANSRDRVQIIDVSLPSSVTVDGRAVPERSVGSAPGWSYQAATATVSVVLPSTPITSATTIVERGGSPVERAEPQLGTAAS